MREPSPRSMNLGVPPTPRKARTGELTPPGMCCWALAKRASEREVFIGRSSKYDAGFIGDNAVQKTIENHFLNGAVDIAEQTVLELEIRLRAGEQILHEIAETGAAIHELDHALGHGAEQEAAEEHALGERGGELEVVDEF